MKRRMISVLLTVCMVLALFAGLSVNAAADNETIQHKMASGETVIGICQKLGIDFHANYRWITETNKITNYNNLKAGTVLTLPAPGTVPGTTSSAVTGNGASGQMNKELLPGDYVSSYLIPHVMQRGETVAGVCSSLGVNFNSVSAQIQRFNNIQDYRRIFVGRTIYIPMSQPPASGPCIAMVAHKVVSGDAMFNICAHYGVDYKSSLKMIQDLNGRNDDFSNIKVGQTIMLPVSAVFSPAPSGGGNGGAGGNVTPGGNGGSGGNGEGTAPSGKTYKITKLTTNHGSFDVPSSAKAGQTVSVKTSPAWTYQTGTITVTCGGKSVPVTDGKFVMPEGDVKVGVKFISEETHTIYRGEEKNGRFNTSVNGNITDKAAHTQIVYVNAEAKYGYELDKITVSYNKGTSFVPLRSDGRSFEMPDNAVKVDVTFKKTVAHSIAISAVNGSATAQINGRNVSEAHSGDTIRISVKPDSSYKLADIAVTTKTDGYKVSVSDNSFIMPNDDVKVEVKFAKDVYKINIEQPANGSVSVDRTSAEAGTPITVTVNPAANYAVKSVTADGKAVSISGVSGSFTMPANDVTVRAEFVPQTKSLSVFQNGNGTSSSSNAKPSYGETVTINTKPDKGWELESIVAVTGSGKNITVGDDGSFKMPAENVNVTVNYKPIRFSITVISGANGTARTDKTTAIWTEEVTVSATPYGGGEIASITVTDANGNNVSVDSNNKFKMPCSNATVNVSFRSVSTYYIDKAVEGEGSFGIQVDGLAADKAKAGQTVNIVDILPVYGHEFKSITVKAGDKTIAVNGNSFVMPEAKVTVTVKFS